MTSNVITANPATKRPPTVDALNVGGKNAKMHEALLNGGDDRSHIEGIIARMREAGCSESTLALMRNPQPFL